MIQQALTDNLGSRSTSFFFLCSFFFIYRWKHP